MTDAKEYSFILGANKKMRHIAGPRAKEGHEPQYEISIEVPSHVRDLVKCEQVLIGTPDNCQVAWKIENCSTWPAFITIKIDGQMIKYTE